MLKQRVITAVILLALLLPALFAASPLPFAGLTLVLISAAGWEWGRLNGLTMRGALRLGAVCLIVCLWIWQARWAYQSPWDSLMYAAQLAAHDHTYLAPLQYRRPE